MDPIEDRLNKIVDPNLKKNEKLELKGVIRGEVRNIIREAVEGKRKNEMFKEDIGALKLQKVLI